MGQIGYKSYDKPHKSNKNLPAKVEVSNSIPMTAAQADLCESISELSCLIVSPQFSTFSIQQKATFVCQLTNFSALNAELTAKTILLATCAPLSEK